MRNTELLFISTLKDIYDADEAKTLARMCLMRVLDTDLVHLITQSPLSLSDSQNVALQGMLSRLAASEPVQYVLGDAEFKEAVFKVSPAVLIPRPETSELVDWVVSDYKGKENITLLDAGTGSGCIAVSLARLLPDAKVSAVDVSDDAIAVASDNAKNNGVEVDFSHFDLLNDEPSDSMGAFSAIVSNPPYVCLSEKKSMERNVLDYEPGLALFVTDDDPLVFYRRIAQLGLKVLQKGGRLYFEINERFGAEMRSMLMELGYNDVLLRQDFYGKDRMMCATLN